MRPYEVMLILDASVDEPAINANVDRIKDLVKSRKGVMGQVEKWGLRRFTHEIKHRWEGNYTVIELTAEPGTVAEVDRMLTLADDVVRHKIVRLPESVAGRTSRPAPSFEAASAAASHEGKRGSKSGEEKS